MFLLFTFDVEVELFILISIVSIVSGWADCSTHSWLLSVNFLVTSLADCSTSLGVDCSTDFKYLWALFLSKFERI